MSTKRESLTGIEESYLRRLSNHLNSKKRDYSALTKDDLLDRVSSKLTVNETEELISSIDQGLPPHLAAEKVTPATAREIRLAVEDFFGHNGVYEVKVGTRRCDIVFPDTMTAVEIKSARDEIGRAEGQVSQYKKWADQVFLAYDEVHGNSIPRRLLKNGVGLLAYRDGKIELMKDAENNKTDPADRLNWLTYDAISDYAREYGIAAIGSKEDIARRLSSNLDPNEVSEVFCEYLWSRG